jgi:hypothetical protein
MDQPLHGIDKNLVQDEKDRLRVGLSAAETHPASEPDMRQRLKASLNPELYKQQRRGCESQHQRHERRDKRNL